MCEQYQVTVGGHLIAICFDAAIAALVVEALRQLSDCDDGDADPFGILGDSEEILDQYAPGRIGS